MNDIHSKLSEDTNLLGHLNNITDQFKVIGDRNSSEQNQKNLVDSTTYQGSLMILFNELAQTYIFSTFYWIFQFLIPAIQILALMISPFISSIWETSNGTGKFIKILTCMISFSPNTYKDEFDIAGTVVISTIYVIIGIWFSILPLFYMKFKQYPKPILYISVLFYQIVVPMLILPFSANASLVFTLISDSITGASVFLVILIIIITALIIIGFIFLSSFTSFLISPSSSFTASYGGYHPTLVVVSSCVYIFLTKLAQLFEPWLEILIIVLHIGINAFFIYESFQFDFVKFGMNVYSSSYYSSIIIAHILNIIKIGGVNVPDLVRIIVPYSCFILFGIFYYFFFSKIESVALSILSVDDLHTDEMKKEYYDSLGIHSAQQFIRLCRIGMSNLPPLYIDWTFPVYSCEITSNEKLLLSTALFVSFFPAEQQAADYFIDRISKNIMTSFRDRFIMFRIKSIYAKRFASNSHISNKVYQQAKIESENTLIEIRDFWITISSSPELIFLADLELLGSKLKRTKRKWKEALEQFPNDSRFPDGFSYFLLETMVDPENGVFMKLKSNHLMKGFAADLDKIYRAFAVARPMILKNKICDKKGNIKRNAFELTNGMTTTTISTTAVEKLADDIDSGILDKMIKELYLWPNIRKLLYNATSHYKPRLSTL
ncbi:hypothetical protein TRFO_22076 [Tritrichomonas foetus]|uniref:Uncharacterized protein n=1 Tax=Tritrichomonas foetus TaxID=1144522 RepID=A0A1J4KH49_9EUKA|nr:hypothetical protein TRFO_22076 [Tritrichomonas foetus]|eukprot:OHT09156.1 hypothetical protein TRFO_22076 [Tritrichomonas foetus]